MNYFQLETEIGAITFSWNESGLLTGIHWKGPKSVQANRSFLLTHGSMSPALVTLLDRFRAYFDRGLPIGEIPWHCVDPSQLTEFQIAVYNAISKIPHGETRNYAWVAERIGNPLAARAVGQALRKNPFPILIPCHRVVATKGLGGFMGKLDPKQPELLFKKTLIELEVSYRNPVFPFLDPLPKAFFFMNPVCATAGGLG